MKILSFPKRYECAIFTSGHVTCVYFIYILQIKCFNDAAKLETDVISWLCLSKELSSQNLKFFMTRILTGF